MEETLKNLESELKGNASGNAENSEGGSSFLIYRLIALADQIVADGMTPFCFGMYSNGATGWLATDWMEDICLLYTSPSPRD